MTRGEASLHCPQVFFLEARERKYQVKALTNKILSRSASSVNSARTDDAPLAYQVSSSTGSRPGAGATAATKHP